MKDRAFYILLVVLNILLFGVIGFILLQIFYPSALSSLLQPASDCRTFAETRKAVCGRFLAYWDDHGGLPQLGYPVSNSFQEVAEADGKSYTVQYFERTVLRLHPGSEPPDDVEIPLLGEKFYKEKFPIGAPNQKPNATAGSTLFAETGRHLGGLFLQYWKDHGALQSQGYPISDEFVEISDLDGRPYVMQFFERAVFEYHPENKPPYNVLLTQLGTYEFRHKYPQGEPRQPTPTPTPARR